ncbi:MAG TPA: hypothetical protein VJG49_03920, partial [Candidatus Nanoarchaeia archaeon]|nr:hypothetical protein [Candidatus Nanoarchaeia archaeon]
EETAIMNEFLWLKESKEAIKKYFENDQNLHSRLGSGAKQKRVELHEHTERRDVRRLAKFSQRLLQRLSEVESEASNEVKAKIEAWKREIGVYDKTIIELMGYPDGEFETELKRQVFIVKDILSKEDKDVEKKYENLILILDKAMKAVEGLAAVEKQIKETFG